MLCQQKNPEIYPSGHILENKGSIPDHCKIAHLDLYSRHILENKGSIRDHCKIAHLDLYSQKFNVTLDSPKKYILRALNFACQLI